MAIDFTKKVKDYSDDDLNNALEFLNSKKNKKQTEKIYLNKLNSEKAKRESYKPPVGAFVGEEMLKQLESNSVLIDLDTNLIIDNGIQDRSGLDEEKQKELDESISEHKLLHPILVKRNDDGTYTRIFGRRRLRSHKRLGIPTIKAYIYEGELTLQQLRLMILHENIIREDLNEYDKVRNILELLKEPLKTDDEKEIIELVQKAKNLNENTKEKEYIKEVKKIVEDILHRSKLYKTISTLINALPVLTMNTLLLDALKKNKITFTQAKVFNGKKKVITNAKLDYDAILKHAIKNEFSKNEYTEYIDGLLPKKSSNDLDLRLKKINTQIKKIDSSKKDEFLRKLEKLLKDYN